MATVLAASDLTPAAATPAHPAQGGEIVPFPTKDAAAEARDGIKRLMAMSPDQLRALIADRVDLLENEIKEREARRAALEEARAAQRMLDARRHRAQRIRRRVNMLSSASVALFAGFMVISIL